MTVREKIVLACVAVILLAGTAWSAPAKKSLVMQGTLVDNTCAKAHATDLSSYLKTHGKECALKSQASGFSFLTVDGKLIPFTKKSSPMIVDFLKKDESRMNVEIVYKRVFKYFQLKSIKNRP
jgi:type 1 fimbria pilin